MNYSSQDVLFITITLLNVLLTSGNRQIDLCKPPWWGFTTAHAAREIERMESVIRCGVRFGYCTTNQAPLTELVALADETLFKNILHIKQHDCASSTVAGQNAINLQPSLKKTIMTVH